MQLSEAGNRLRRHGWWGGKRYRVVEMFYLDSVILPLSSSCVAAKNLRLSMRASASQPPNVSTTRGLKVWRPIFNTHSYKVTFFVSKKVNRLFTLSVNLSTGVAKMQNKISDKRLESLHSQHFRKAKLWTQRACSLGLVSMPKCLAEQMALFWLNLHLHPVPFSV